jgi:hypothetical protein
MALIVIFLACGEAVGKQLEEDEVKFHNIFTLVALGCLNSLVAIVSACID